jgi:hypothetical protein
MAHITPVTAHTSASRQAGQNESSE